MWSTIVAATIALRAPNLARVTRAAPSATKKVAAASARASTQRSLLGNRTILGPATVLAALVRWRRCRQLATAMLAAFPASLAIELILKTIVNRPRPPLGHGFAASFPSGHVLAAAAFWGLIPPWTYVLARRRGAWLVSVVMSATVLAVVGVSRIYLNAHWPSDVLGGYLAGSLFLLIAEWAVGRPSRRLHCNACPLHPTLAESLPMECELERPRQ